MEAMAHLVQGFDLSLLISLWFSVALLNCNRVHNCWWLVDLFLMVFEAYWWFLLDLKYWSLRSASQTFDFEARSARLAMTLSSNAGVNSANASLNEYDNKYCGRHIFQPSLLAIPQCFETPRKEKKNPHQDPSQQGWWNDSRILAG